MTDSWKNRFLEINRSCQKFTKMSLEAFQYKRGEFLVLDQTLLPGKHDYVEVKTVEDGWSVINKMQVSIFRDRFYLFQGY